jgi:hypothetical protein
VECPQITHQRHWPRQRTSAQSRFRPHPRPSLSREDATVWLEADWKTASHHHARQSCQRIGRASLPNGTSCFIVRVAKKNGAYRMRQWHSARSRAGPATPLNKSYAGVCFSIAPINERVENGFGKYALQLALIALAWFASISIPVIRITMIKRPESIRRVHSSIPEDHLGAYRQGRCLLYRRLIQTGTPQLTVWKLNVISSLGNWRSIPRLYLGDL